MREESSDDEEFAKVLSEDEQDAIAHYKGYQKRHLPNVRALKDLYAADFDRDVYPDGDIVDGLKKYLDGLESYTRHVKRAAYLRQAHYEQYILGVRNEEPGHTAWREGMNSLAEDCIEKLQYWSQVYSDNLNAVFDRAIERKVHCIDLTVRNCDVRYTDNNAHNVQKVDRMQKKQKIYRPPKISERERAKLNKQYRAQLLEKSREEHKMLDREMEKNSAYHQRIASYDIHKIGNAIEVPIRDIYDMCLHKGVDAPASCTDFVLDFQSGIIPVGDEAEMVDLTLLLYGSISQINDQFCAYYKCAELVESADGNNANTVDSNTADSNTAIDTPYKHNCDKCQIDEIIPESLQKYCHKLDSIINLFGYLIQLNPHAEVAVLTLLNCILTDYRIAWNSYVGSMIMSMIVAGMDDDSIITNINSATQKLHSLREKIRIISRMDIPIETASSAIKTTIGYCTRLNQYIVVLAQLYPAALYHEKNVFMKRLIAENDVIYGSKLIRDGKLFIDPPVVNYAKIKRETGFTLHAPKHIVDNYNSVRREYNAKLREEFKNLTSGQ